MEKPLILNRPAQSQQLLTPLYNLWLLHRPVQPLLFNLLYCTISAPQHPCTTLLRNLPVQPLLHGLPVQLLFLHLLVQPLSSTALYSTVLDYVKPISRYVILRGHALSKGNRWKGKRGMGEGEGWSVYSQPGTRVDGNSRYGHKGGISK
jgi:hypothetical protein